MNELHKKTEKITELVLKAAKKALKYTSTEPGLSSNGGVKWPVDCVVGPGLEGAIACESKIGYVNGLKGSLVYRGYHIFDLCAYSTYEEVSYLLLHGKMPTFGQLKKFKKELIAYRKITGTLRVIQNFPINNMNPMSALRLGTNMLRQEFTYDDREAEENHILSAIAADEDSIPMETIPMGEKHAIYEFKKKKENSKIEADLHSAASLSSCYALIASVPSIAAAIKRIREGHFPIEPLEELSHAANLLYMMTGKIPTPVEERIMDISLILHADHGMNASTFASMVVASTLSDVYFSVGAGIAALNGPLHGGANEKVLHMLKEIGKARKVKQWYNKAIKNKQKITGFGHRVYKTYDPRAIVLRPIAEYYAKKNKEASALFATAKALEKEVVGHLGKKKGIFPNVDFYSGIVYKAMGIPPDMFTPIFAVSRVAGWTARVTEYLQHNRIFRPRAIYSGKFDKTYIPVEERK